MAKPAAPQSPHAGGFRGLGDLLRAGPIRNPPLQLRGHGQNFNDAEPSPVPGHRALRTPHRLIQRHPWRNELGEALADRLGRDLAAVLAQLPHQPLRHDAAKRGRDLVRLHSDVHQPGHRVGGIVGVECGEHQVAGQRSLQRDLRGLLVSDLAHQHHVGVLPQNRAQRGRQRSGPPSRSPGPARCSRPAGTRPGLPP